MVKSKVSNTKDLRYRLFQSSFAGITGKWFIDPNSSFQLHSSSKRK